MLERRFSVVSFGSLGSGMRRAASAFVVCSALVAVSVTGAGPVGAAVTVVRHPLPAPDNVSEPVGVAAGSDGNIWITLAFQSRIARMTPAGVVTDFPYPTAHANAGGIVGGSDGALWFTEEQSDKIGRMTTTGTATEFPLTAGRHPQFIAKGPDGAVWFTEEGARFIGRISPAGVITEFPIPGAGRGAEDIVTGSDGALWFTDPINGRVWAGSRPPARSRISPFRITA